MTRFMFSLLITLMTLTAYSQKDVTKFLGIPVDGSKAEMIQKLKAKGFKSSYYDKDILEGEFNGFDANIMVQTSNNKVWRIIVSYNNLSEEIAKTRFNNLCYQFSKSSKYYSSSSDFTIPEDEDISYEISIKEKRYEAVFYQKSELNIATDNYYEHFLDKSNMDENKFIWFTIQQNMLGYSIVLYYENGYNQANGEDL